VNDLNESNAPVLSDNEHELSMPIGAEDFAAQADPALDPLAGAVTGRKLNGSVVLIVAVVLIAVAGLFSMRKLAQVTAAAVADTDAASKIETFLKSRTGTPDGSGEMQPSTLVLEEAEVLNVLSATYSERQVPLRDVQKNPFMIFLPEAIKVETQNNDPAITEDPEARFREAQAARRTTIEITGSRMELKSIMSGSNPLANIDGAVYRIGETVEAPNSDVVFRVDSIESGKVVLVAEEPGLELSVKVTLSIR
jgi:hypothetical protein